MDGYTRSSGSHAFAACCVSFPSAMPASPWAPQAHIGNDVRTIIFFGHMPGSTDLLPLAGFGVVGALALLAATLLPKRKEAGKQHSVTNL